MAFSRIVSETSIETVDVSMTIEGTRLPFASRPCAPVITSAKSRDPATDVITMSQSPRSAGRSTIRAPRFASGSAFARVRL